MPAAAPHADPPSETERWTLHVHFDPPESVDDPELQFPWDECSRFMAYLGENYATLPEELQQYVSWTPRCVMVSAESLDQLSDVVSWVLAHTIPEHVTVYRNWDR